MKMSFLNIKFLMNWRGKKNYFLLFVIILILILILVNLVYDLIKYGVFIRFVLGLLVYKFVIKNCL